MCVLLIQLVAPMQSWGTSGLAATRDCGLDPSKSGVVGLLAAALGRDRKDSIGDLAGLRMGVRVDREGVPGVDYSATRSLNAAGRWPVGVQTWKHYLADAAFLCGLEGELDLLQQIDDALADPQRVLFLGRASYIPSAPLRLPGGLLPGVTLENALRTWPPIVELRSTAQGIRVVIEDPINGDDRRMDQPISFLPRRYAPRSISTLFLATDSLVAQEGN